MNTTRTTKQITKLADDAMAMVECDPNLTTLDAISIVCGARGAKKYDAVKAEIIRRKAGR